MQRQQLCQFGRIQRRVVSGEARFEPEHDRKAGRGASRFRKSRARLNEEGIKLILGVQGGVCVSCIQLCQEIIEKERAKAP